MLAAALVAVPAIAQAQAAKPASFGLCATCHQVEKGKKSTLGPNLFGIVGRKAASEAGYQYSPAMKKSGITWTQPELLSFIQDPRKKVPGTKMAFAGQKDPKKAAEIADYLAKLK